MFEQITIGSVGSAPNHILAIDVNNDGATDLVVGNTGSGSISVFMNDGDGSFHFSSQNFVGGGSRGLAAGDFNGDGYVDIAAANGGRNVTVALNDGAGAFPTGTNIGGSIQDPGPVVAADFDGDSDTDLVVGTYDLGIHDAWLLRNNGTGGFSASGIYDGREIQWFDVADFDRDGRPDLLGGASSFIRTRILWNEGAGSFGYEYIDSYGLPNHGAAADLNGDGAMDFVVASRSNLQPYLNGGYGAFSSGALYSVPS
ncbi:MAG TPA: VCBS repeat-containing protein, partial [Phycisphaerae bacterium]|nr:VCBS repeat-containing protein [Phycisphaerae bacterium]